MTKENQEKTESTLDSVGSITTMPLSGGWIPVGDKSGIPLNQTFEVRTSEGARYFAEFAGGYPLGDWLCMDYRTGEGFYIKGVTHYKHPGLGPHDLQTEQPTKPPQYIPFGPIHTSEAVPSEGQEVQFWDDGLKRWLQGWYMSFNGDGFGDFTFISLDTKGHPDVYTNVQWWQAPNGPPPLREIDETPEAIPDSGQVLSAGDSGEVEVFMNCHLCQEWMSLVLFFEAGSGWRGICTKCDGDIYKSEKEVYTKRQGAKDGKKISFD